MTMNTKRKKQDIELVLKVCITVLNSKFNASPAEALLRESAGTCPRFLFKNSSVSVLINSILSFITDPKKTLGAIDNSELNSAKNAKNANMIIPGASSPILQLVALNVAHQMLKNPAMSPTKAIDAMAKHVRVDRRTFLTETIAKCSSSMYSFDYVLEQINNELTSDRYASGALPPMHCRSLEKLETWLQSQR